MPNSRFIAPFFYRRLQPGLIYYRRRVFRHERLSLLRGIARLHDTATARAQQAKRMGRIGALLTPSKGRFSYKRDACEKSQMTQRAKFKASDEISLKGNKSQGGSQ